MDDALRQAAELAELDAPRAEAWASDLLALVDEVCAERGAERLVAELAAASTAASAAALHAIAAVDSSLTEGVDIAGTAPEWADALGTSECEGAWLLHARRGTSAALRFVDRDDVRHVISVDLVPGPPERVGEVTVGPGELLEAVEEDDAEIDVDEASPAEVAARIIDAFEATDRPRSSAVVNGRLLVARLAPLADRALVPPAPVADEVPELRPRDPDDDTFARDVLARALGDPPPPEEASVASAASALRTAAAIDAPLAQWLAATPGPIDLDEPDLDVVLAAVAAAVAPARLEPLDPDARDAVVVLEWADWLGAVLGLVRLGDRADTGPMALVDQVNRCPEVTTTIPKHDRERVAWAFAVCTESWSELGLADGRRLTPFGAAVLPLALDRAWLGSAES